MLLHSTMCIRYERWSYPPPILCTVVVNFTSVSGALGYAYPCPFLDSEKAMSDVHATKVSHTCSC